MLSKSKRARRPKSVFSIVPKLMSRPSKRRFVSILRPPRSAFLVETDGRKREGDGKG